MTNIMVDAATRHVIQAETLLMVLCAFAVWLMFKPITYGKYRSARWYVKLKIILETTAPKLLIITATSILVQAAAIHVLKNRPPDGALTAVGMLAGLILSICMWIMNYVVVVLVVVLILYMTAVSWDSIQVELQSSGISPKLGVVLTIGIAMIVITAAFYFAKKSYEQLKEVLLTVLTSAILVWGIDDLSNFNDIDFESFVQDSFDANDCLSQATPCAIRVTIFGCLVIMRLMLVWSYHTLNLSMSMCGECCDDEPIQDEDKARLVKEGNTSDDPEERAILKRRLQSELRRLEKEEDASASTQKGLSKKDIRRVLKQIELEEEGLSTVRSK